MTLTRSRVSVKGVAVQDGRVLLLENERAEWELPGGKLEIDEDPPTVTATISGAQLATLGSDHSDGATRPAS